MGKKCKKKVVWKQLNLGGNSVPIPSSDGFSYSDVVSGNPQYGHDSNRHNGKYLENGDDKSCANSLESVPYNNRRQNYKHNRSNRHNGYKWRRRVDRPMEDDAKENFNSDAEQIIQDDSGMYVHDAGSATLAGVVVQQLYPGGPMVSIPVHYGQYVSPTLIPGDPTLLTLDPSYTRIINADEMEDVCNMLPLQLDANGQPITVEVKVDMNGVPIEIEPRGFQVFEGNIEEEDYFVCSAPQQEPNAGDRPFDQIEEGYIDEEPETTCETPTDDDPGTCGTPSDEEPGTCGTPSDEEAGTCDIPSDEEAVTCDTPSDEEAVTFSEEEPEVSHENTVEVKTGESKEEVKDVKETEECSSDSQYATMSESSSPNTPASELSDPSDMPEQAVQPKLSGAAHSSSDKCNSDATQKPTVDMNKQSVAVKQTLVSDCLQAVGKREETLPDQSLKPKQKLKDNKVVKSSKEIVLQSMSRKKRKREAKLLKKQNKTDKSTTPTVIIREKNSPTLLTFNSSNASNQFATKSLRSSMAFLNSPSFSVQQFLKCHSTLQKYKSPLENSIDPSNIMTSPLEGFGHIDLSYYPILSKDNIEIRKNSLAETPQLKSHSKPNALLHGQAPLVHYEDVSEIEEASSLTAIEECADESTVCSATDLENYTMNTKTDILNSTDVIIQDPDISNCPSEKQVDEDVPSFPEQIDESHKELFQQNTLETAMTENVINCEASEEVEYSSADNHLNTMDTVFEDQSNQSYSDTTTDLVEESEKNVNISSDENEDCINPESYQNIASSKNHEYSPVIAHDMENNIEIYNVNSDSQADTQEIDADETELLCEDHSSSGDVMVSKKGYVMVPVLTPYYSPTVFYGYPLVMPDNGEDSGKFNRKKKRRFKKKYENQQQFYDANALPGNPYIATDDGFVIPVDPSQACHIHSCQYIPTAFPQQGASDEGFVSAESTPYLPNYAPEPGEAVPVEGELFGNLQNHERDEIAEVLKENPKLDSAESGDSGVSESEEFNKNVDKQKEEKSNNKSKKQQSAVNSNNKKESKPTRKLATKNNKNSKPFMVITEPDFSCSNSNPFNDKSATPDLSKVNIKNDHSKKKNKKQKRGKNKKSKACHTDACNGNELKLDSPVDISTKNHTSVVNSNDKNVEDVVPHINTSHLSTTHPLTDELGYQRTAESEIPDVTEESFSSNTLINENIPNSRLIDENRSVMIVNKEQTSSIIEDGENQFNVKEISNMKCNDEESSSVAASSTSPNDVENNNYIEDDHIPTDNGDEILHKVVSYVGDECCIKNISISRDDTDDFSTSLPGSSNIFDHSSLHLSSIPEENAAGSLKDLDVCGKENSITIFSNGHHSLSPLEESSDILSTIEETNEDSSEFQNIVDDFDGSIDNNISSNISRSMSKDSLMESINSDNDHQISVDSGAENHPIHQFAEDKTAVNGGIINPALGKFSHEMASKLEEDSPDHHLEISSEHLNTDVPDIMKGCHQNGIVENGTDLMSNLDCPTTELLLVNDKVQQNEQAVGNICKSLGVTKAVERWIQEITPAKAFICNESQNSMFQEIMAGKHKRLEERKNSINTETKNVEGNRFTVSRNSMTDGEEVADCPRELLENNSRRSTITDLSSEYETATGIDNCDPSLFSRYYQLGVYIDTPLSSNSSSRDTSSNRTVHESYQKHSTDEIDNQDSFYHSNKTDDVISSAPGSEKMTCLITDNSCSDVATCNILQDGKSSCSKETECASLFSSGIGSSLASTPLTSPSHLPPLPNLGKNSFPPQKQTDPQCAIL